MEVYMDKKQVEQVCTFNGDFTNSLELGGLDVCKNKVL